MENNGQFVSGDVNSLTNRGQLIALCLLGSKPFSETDITNWQLEPAEQTSVKFESKYNEIDWEKHI